MAPKLNETIFFFFRGKKKSKIIKKGKTQGLWKLVSYLNSSTLMLSLRGSHDEDSKGGIMSVNSPGSSGFPFLDGDGIAELT